MLVPSIIVFIAGVLICMENIKVLYRYYVYNVEGSMIPFIGGVLLLAGIGTIILDKSLNHKMVTVLFDIAFVYWPLMIIICAILWIISKIAFGIL